MNIIAHRGASYWAPEQTRTAYQLAARFGGADFWELDLQRTRDGKLVCFHDNDLSRVAGKPSVPGALKLDELEALDFGSWFNRDFPKRARPAYSGAKVLTFDSLIALANRWGAGLCVEFKEPNRYLGIEEQALAEACEKFSGRLILQSFDAECLRRLKGMTLPKDARTCLLVESLECPGSGDPIKLACDLGVDGMGVAGNLFGQKLLEVPRICLKFRAWIRKARAAGLWVGIWTLNTEIQMRLFKALGADGIYTDRPELAQAVLARKPRMSNAEVEQIIKTIEKTLGN